MGGIEAGFLPDETIGGTNAIGRPLFMDSGVLNPHRNAEIIGPDSSQGWAGYRTRDRIVACSPTSICKTKAFPARGGSAHAGDRVDYRRDRWSVGHPPIRWNLAGTEPLSIEWSLRQPPIRWKRVPGEPVSIKGQIQEFDNARRRGWPPQVARTLDDLRGKSGCLGSAFRTIADRTTSPSR